MNEKRFSRRNFLQKTALTAGMTPFVALGSSEPAINDDSTSRLPREVWIASFSQEGLRSETSGQMVDNVLQQLDNIGTYQPDIVCLSENFIFDGVKQRYNIGEKVKESENAMKKVSGFSSKNNCYSICPAYTTEGGNIYNAAVLFDRKGKSIGEYRKIHPTEGEIESGITPGPIHAPVFHTDFGTIGIQICFDMFWDDGWSSLKEQGAEIVFFTSEMPGGQMVNAKAWQHKYVVVSSTREMTAKICDVTGEIIDQTGFWNANVLCAAVNLEKAFLHIWPYAKQFIEIKKKYGRKVRIRLYHEEQWAVIESLSRDLKVKDILKEYGLKTHEEHIKSGTIAQMKSRPISK